MSISRKLTRTFKGGWIYGKSSKINTRTKTRNTRKTRRTRKNNRYRKKS